MFSRTVITKNSVTQLLKSRYSIPQSDSTELKLDNYIALVSKSIPSEIIGVYLTAITLLKEGPIKDSTFLFWGIFVICLSLTPIYLKYIYKVNYTNQLIVSSLAFIFWALTIGSPFELIFEHSKFIGSMILPIFSLLIPLFTKSY
jgi:hypothetical protein